ncbi:MAG: SIR2 family NAD-dependent protein deacylase [Candidatus Aphodosoma sp.]
MIMIAVLTGAGISADSGIATFRDSDGLWADYRVEDVCTPEALERSRAQVIGFYNIRRRELLAAKPNAAHEALARLERHADVCVITQNIDDLHERAGTRNLIHLHGELRKLRSSWNETAVVPIDGWEQQLDARHPDGSLLRPFVVFFGESVPMLEEAVKVVQRADILLVVGTSLNVYPAAGLVNCTRPDVPVYIVDPAVGSDRFRAPRIPNPVTCIAKRAAEGVPQLVDRLLSGL